MEWEKLGIIFNLENPKNDKNLHLRAFKLPTGSASGFCLIKDRQVTFIFIIP